MIKPAIPENELCRLAALADLNLLDTPPEERFDRFTRLAQHLFQVPIALITLVDANRQWFKSNVGLSVAETSREVSFCGHAILKDDPLIVPNAAKDVRFADNPLVTGEPHIRFYAGYPLRTANGSRVGTLCLIDRRPRRFSAQKIALLRDLASMVENEWDRVESQRIQNELLRTFQTLARETERRRKREAELETLKASLENQVALRTAELTELTEHQRDLLRGVRCLVWHATVYDRKGEAPGTFYWQLHISDEIAAQRFFPLDLAPGQTYIDAWVASIQTDKDQLDQNAYKALTSGLSSYSQEYQCRQADGQVRWLYEDVFVRPNGPKSWKLVGICTDITERKWAENTLKKNTEQIQTIFNQAPIGIYTFLSDGRILRVNHAVEKMVGYSSTELASMNCFDLALPTDHKIARKAREILPKLKKGSVYRWEQRFVCKNGQIRWAYLNVSVLEKNENATKLLAMVEDITQERQKQAYLQQQERLATVGQLAAGIAHDFNNILTVIMGAAQMLHFRPGLPAPVRDDMAEIQRQGTRAAQLVRQILDFSRKTVTRNRPVDLSHFLKEGLKLLTRTLPATIRIDSDLTAGSTIMGDLAQLQQILTNLAFNARDAMPEGGTIGVCLKNKYIEQNGVPGLPGLTPGNWVVLTFSDTGTGMPPEVLKRLFEPFFTTKEPGQGTGLGLAQVYGIVKQHNGEITVDSTPDKGTTFQIYLPCMPGGVQISKQPKPQIVRGQGETVLVVEDDATVRESLHKMLTALNYQVLIAKNGQHALALLEQNREAVKLVISDLMMPVLNGRQFVENIGQVPAIMISGYSLDEDLFPPNVVAKLSKPVNLETLSQAARQALTQ